MKHLNTSTRYHHSDLHMYRVFAFPTHRFKLKPIDKVSSNLFPSTSSSRKTSTGISEEFEGPTRPCVRLEARKVSNTLRSATSQLKTRLCTDDHEILDRPAWLKWLQIYNWEGEDWEVPFALLHVDPAHYKSRGYGTTHEQCTNRLGLSTKDIDTKSPSFGHFAAEVTVQWTPTEWYPCTRISCNSTLSKYLKRHQGIARRLYCFAALARANQVCDQEHEGVSSNKEIHQSRYSTSVCDWVLKEMCTGTLSQSATQNTTTTIIIMLHNILLLLYNYCISLLLSYYIIITIYNCTYQDSGNY